VLFLAIVLTDLVVGVSASSASRAPRHAERRAIVRAIVRSPATRLARGKFTVTGVRVSTVDQTWGKALLKPKRRYRHTLDPAMTVLHRRGGRWRVRTVGTAQVGCVIPRRAVRRDLGLSCV
jgi:hypothetical protein